MAKVKKSKGDLSSPIKKKKKKILSEVIPDMVDPPITKGMVETAAQKYQRELQEEVDRKDREKRAYNALTTMKRRDTQKECVLRGIKFEDASGLSTPQLAGWFTDHIDDGLDLTRLDEYDAWRMKQLELRGNLAEDNSLRHPALKFGIAGSSNDWDDKSLKNSTKTIRESKAIDKPVKEKINREKDENTGIFTGTKKHYTYSLQDKGKSIEETVALVLEKFPDANDKSIKIWYKRSEKANK